MAKYTVSGKVIVLTFDKSLYLPLDSKYNKLIDRFVIQGISPDTVSGKIKITLTNYDRMKEFCLDAEKYGQPDPANPIQTRFVDFIQEILTDGVLILPDYKFKRGDNCYFGIDFFVKLSNDQLSETVPEGIIGCFGSGEEGDAEPDQLRTWQQWYEFQGSGYYFETDTETIIYYPVNQTSKQSEVLALLNSTFEVLDMNEVNVFVIDNTLIAE